MSGEVRCHGGRREAWLKWQRSESSSRKSDRFGIDRGRASDGATLALPSLPISITVGDKFQLAGYCDTTRFSQHRL